MSRTLSKTKHYRPKAYYLFKAAMTSNNLLMDDLRSDDVIS